MTDTVLAQPHRLADFVLGPTETVRGQIVKDQATSLAHVPLAKQRLGRHLGSLVERLDRRPLIQGGMLTSWVGVVRVWGVGLGNAVLAKGRCIMKRLVFSIAVLMTFTAALADGAVVVYDLAADWSDTTNPNGVWSYNKGAGDPILTHQDPWSPGTTQSGWAEAPMSDRGHIPVWLKSVGWGGLPAGRVGVHTTDSYSANPSAGIANVTWTSPIAGTIVVSGGVWLPGRTYDRPQAWRVLDQNDLVVASGSLTINDPYTASNPFLFEETMSVSAGDVITTELYKLGNVGYWVGLDLTITAQPIPEPSSLIVWSLIALTFGGFGWWRRRKAG